MKIKRRTTLLRYWTTRYVITLVIGLMFLGLFSVWWMGKITLEYRLHLLKYLADETSDRVIKENGNIVIGPILSGIINEREEVLSLNEEPLIYITDTEGEIIFAMPQVYIKSGEKVQKTILESEKAVQKIKLNEGGKAYVVKSPIESSDKTISGWVFIIQKESSLMEVNRDHGLLVIMLCGLGFLGYGVIYVLSRKISRPIRNVARAAGQIREGNYDINLMEETAREEEIYELIQAFKEMTLRLKQMEKLRAELFAGVTHDLKTPVTSISGMVQAVKDDIVTGEESKEFLEITLKETMRLQRMIEDLLDYNALSAGSIKIRLETVNVNELIEEITYQWKVTQDDQNFELTVEKPDRELYCLVDALRLQEIMINLLNNAKQSLGQDGRIKVSLYYNESKSVCLDIEDNGKGIPESEQMFVFEPFYRGEKKKLKVRGLGLGLPFSRMLAKAQKGELLLKSSSESGTTFTVILSEMLDVR